MWIRTQNKQRIINSDRTSDIFVDGTGIIANIIGYITPVTLGEFKDRDTCLRVLESISVVIGSRIPMITMPLDGEIDTWSKDIAELATVYIANEF